MILVVPAGVRMARNRVLSCRTVAGAGGWLLALPGAPVCAITKAAHSSWLLRDEGLVVIVPSYGAFARGDA